jgi:hypothetical protein
LPTFITAPTEAGPAPRSRSADATPARPPDYLSSQTSSRRATLKMLLVFTIAPLDVWPRARAPIGIEDDRPAISRCPPRYPGFSPYRGLCLSGAAPSLAGDLREAHHYPARVRGCMYCKHPVGGKGRRNFDPLPHAPGSSPYVSTGDYTAGRKSRANSARIRCRSRSRSASRASVPSSIALTPNMNTTDRIGDAGHAHALHRGACHRPSMWQAGSAGGKGCPLLSRACEERGWGPLGPVRPAYISDAP